MIENIGLVLEGGGMRGVYTAGILDYFLEANIDFPYAIGVSAGSAMAASYISKQKGRNYKVNIDMIHDKRYFSWSNFIKNRELFGMDFIFREIPTSIVPFDEEAFFDNPAELVIGTTDCITGETVYYKKEDYGKDMLTILQASSSLPFISKETNFKGRILLDGGITDPIPIRKAIQDGYKKNVVILTRNADYRKKPSRFNFLAKRKYPQYHGLLQAMEIRYKVYNETLKFLKEKEKEGKVFILRPEQPLEVGRMETDRQKLEKLYHLGYEQAKRNHEQLQQFLLSTEYVK